MSRSTTLRLMKARIRMSPAMRVMATVVLMCWSTALAICWHHCATGACSGSVKPAAQSQPSCHGHAASEPDNPPASDAGNSCFAKQPFSGKAELIAAQAPTLELAYAIASLPVEDVLPARGPVTLHRRSQTRGWVFTPEVSLGPAFRSLAPPTLS
jgi:hypothetical protein